MRVTVIISLLAIACTFALVAFNSSASHDSVALIHSGFSSPIQKVEFIGQQRRVTLEDSDSVNYLKDALSKAQLGGDAGLDYYATVYLDNGEIIKLDIMVTAEPEGMTLLVYDRGVFGDPSLYQVKFEKPLPPKLAECMSTLLAEQK